MRLNLIAGTLILAIAPLQALEKKEQPTESKSPEQTGLQSPPAGTVDPYKKVTLLCRTPKNILLLVRSKNRSVPLQFKDVYKLLPKKGTSQEVYILKSPCTLHPYSPFAWVKILRSDDGWTFADGGKPTLSRTAQNLLEMIYSMGKSKGT
ncbi:MAG: hypothetical protein M1549_00350 [Candidatus Dependentiae bacterium]|nr:hypothetical protein [Candidatus Dependentiae bacterium]